MPWYGHAFVAHINMKTEHRIYSSCMSTPLKQSLDKVVAFVLIFVRKQVGHLYARPTMYLIVKRI